jgi:glycyl-tRNA synthetase
LETWQTLGNNTVKYVDLEDQTVTIRMCEAMRQERVGLDAVESYLAARLPGC